MNYAWKTSGQISLDVDQGKKQQEAKKRKQTINDVSVPSVPFYGMAASA